VREGKQHGNDEHVHDNRHHHAVAQVDGASDGLDVGVAIVEVEVHQ
jgi:hypothetical protein